MTDVAELEIRADSSEVKVANKDLKEFSKTGKASEDAAKKFTKAALGMVSIGAITATFFKVAQAHIQYTAALSDLSAITGAVGKDLQFYNEEAKKIGATTTLSASQAAVAFKLIASAKPDLLASKEALAAVTKEAVTLAEASGLTMPAAANALGSSLNQFSADADEASRFINVLAAGAKFGASEINETSMALKVAGTVAAGLGLSFEEANAAIQAMASVSIKGSEAGTGLRGVLLKLSTQAKTEFNPEIVGLSTALENLAEANLTTTEKVKLFGLESITAASALINQADSIDALTKSLTDTDTAYIQASVRVDNLEGDLKKLDSASEDVALTIGDTLDPALRGTIQTVTEITKPIKVLILEFADLGDMIGAMIAVTASAATLDFGAIGTIISSREDTRAQLDLTIAAIWEENGARKDGIAVITEEEQALLDKAEAAKAAEKESADALKEQLKIEKLRAVQIAEELAATEKLQKAYSSLADELDPVGRLIREYVKNWELLDDAAASKALGLSVDEVDGMRDSLISALEDGLKPFNKELDDTFEKMSNNIAMVTTGFSSLQGVFEEGSKGMQIMQIATQAASAVQAVHAVLNQASGDPYTAFARMAVMAASVAQLGFSVGSFGNGPNENISAERQASQGTGSVLGDLGAKSESISRAVEITASASEELVGINTNMLSALEDLTSSISGVVTKTARSASGVDLIGPSINEDIFSFAHELGDFVGSAFLGIGKILGGRSREVDKGIQIIGGDIQALVDGAIINAFSTFESKKHAFDDYDTSESVVNLGDDISKQFGLVFESIISSVISGAEALGVTSAEIQLALDEFFVETQKISLKDLDAEAQEAEISAVFSKIFDDLVESVVPFISDFQKAGEGLGETLARVVTEVQVVDEAMNRLGFSMSGMSTSDVIEASNALIELSGGIEKFITNMKGFVDNFATDERKLRILTSEVTAALSRQGLALPETRDGFWDLMEAQNASTEAGAENIATLLKIQKVADEFYSAIEDNLSDAVDRQASIIEDSAQRQIDAIKDQESVRIKANTLFLDAARLGVSSLEKELSGIKSASDKLSGAGISQITRQSQAIAFITNALSTGNLTGTGSAAGIAAGIDPSQFSTSIEFSRQLGITRNLLSQLEAEGIEQKTIAEQTVDLLSLQIDAIREQAQLQINAINEASKAEIEMLSMITSIADIDRVALRGFGNAAIGESKSISRIEETARQSKQSSEALSVEVKGLRVDLGNANRAIAKNTLKTANLLTQFDVDGMPETRVL